MDNNSTSLFNVFNIAENPVNTTKEFFESNSLIAKIAFLLLIIFLFVIFLNLGISLISWFYSSVNSPHLINGAVSAKQLLVFPQDPSSNTNNSKLIIRSDNENDGIEFTWSVWIFIDDLQYLQGQYKHIFSKGNSNINSNGLVFPNNSPGLYIAPNTNSLFVVLNTFNVINEQIEIPDIPLNKWVNIILRCKNTDLDIFINGNITRSVKLPGIPKQNYGDVFQGLNGGFSGFVSDLWYYDYALRTTEIQKLIIKGPNKKLTGTNGMNNTNNDYLSLRWYFYGIKDMFNPGPVS